MLRVGEFEPDCNITDASPHASIASCLVLLPCRTDTLLGVSYTETQFFVFKLRATFEFDAKTIDV